jgi:hypothetical protein
VGSVSIHASTSLLTDLTAGMPQDYLSIHGSANGDTHTHDPSESLLQIQFFSSHSLLLLLDNIATTTSRDEHCIQLMVCGGPKKLTVLFWRGYEYSTVAMGNKYHWDPTNLQLLYKLLGGLQGSTVEPSFLTILPVVES